MYLLNKMKNMFKKNNSIVKGFTLIEIAVVIGIMVIITAIAIPRMGSFYSSTQLAGAMEKLTDDFKYVQDFAVTQHTNTWIDFDDVLETYTMYSGDALATRSVLYDPARNEAAPFTIEDQFKGVEIFITTFTGSSISYNWWGTPSSSGYVILTVGSHADTVYVEQETGFVHY